MKNFALTGLMSWYENMIPTLLPFMVFTGFLIHLHWESIVIQPIFPLFQKLFHLKPELIFEILLGFLCGFPMGSKITCELYQKNRITQAEAQYLLSFTNNVSPAFFIGFVYETFYQTESLLLMLFLQYGIALLYGLFLRYSVFRSKIPFHYKGAVKENPSGQRRPDSMRQLVEALDDAINVGLIQIAALGGYMVIFNTLVFFPVSLLKEFPFVSVLTHLLMEISGGLESFQHYQLLHRLSRLQSILVIQAMLTLNGFCCLFQTIKYMKPTNLSVKKYMLHKGILCSITIVSILILIK